MHIQDAAELIQRGARSGLVLQLTRLKKAQINRMVRDLTGVVSRQGQSTYTEAWYLKHEHRMLQAAVVWQLHQRLHLPTQRPARILLQVFDTYRQRITEPLLTIGRVAYVPHLVAMGTWHARDCRICRAIYLASATPTLELCPGCRLYSRYRCPNCGYAFKPTGRRYTVCPHCHAPRWTPLPTWPRKDRRETE